MDKNSAKKIPVVVILGHVDAGKSSILDFIRKTKIVEKESGGITQHVGVYESELKNQRVTFIDTPGHAAFSTIRSRGAKIADIAILVIAVDQGILPQTKEAIAYLKETKIPTIVVFNKTDLPSEKLNAIKGQLNKEGITVESMGGLIPSLNISAKTGQGMDDLIDMILLLSEMGELKTKTSDSMQGIVIESNSDSFRGPIAVIIIKQGVLSSGDIIATPSTCGKIKGLFDFENKKISQANSGQAAIVLGFNQVPKAGEIVQVCKDLDEARALAKEIENEIKLEINDEESFNIILKADVNSSLEAIKTVLQGMPQDKMKINIIASETGDISQNNVTLAQNMNADIIGFNVGLNSGVRGLLEKANVKFSNFDIIYKLTEYVAEELKRRREPEESRREIGKLEVLAIFKTEKNRQIIGGNVIEGQIEKSAKLDVFRGKDKIGQGKIVNLECRKKKMDIVPKGQQAGILYEGTGRIEEGDLIEAYFIDLL